MFTRPTAARVAGLLIVTALLPFAGLATSATAQDSSDLTTARSAFEAAWAETPLHFDTVLFVEGPASGYGAYVPRLDTTFVAGETMYIYAQPRAYGFGRSGRLHTIALEFDVALLDADGAVLVQQDGFGSFAFQSYEANREIMFNADIDTDLEPGDYTLVLRLRDGNKEGDDITELPFSIAPE